MTDELIPDTPLDQALRQIIVAPDLPAGFRQRLTAAIARSVPEDLASARQRLERERLEQLMELREASVRLKLKTLGALIGGAFTAGVGLALAWPWISATFAPHGDFALLAISVSIGLAIALTSWLQGTGQAPWER
jgi:hypothetical protein